MKPGPHNAITDVPGVLVGQVERVDAPYLTGTTVVHVPATAVAGVDVRGGAPGTRETDLLDPVNSNSGVNAVVLTGGSGYGLDTAGSVMRWLENRGEGVRVGLGDNEVVPIVPAAVIFDLGRGGGFQARPEPSWGADAIAAADDGPVALGNHGAGAGARARSLKGGVGSASVRLDDGTTVGALVIVNAAGSTVDGDGNLYGARYGIGDEFTHLRTPTEPPPPAAPGRNLIPGPPMNTVIAVVATDVPLDKAAGRVVATSVVPYPPGIPMVMPGENLGPANGAWIGYLRALRDWDARFPGFGHETHGVEVRAGEHYLQCVKPETAAQTRAKPR